MKSGCGTCVERVSPWAHNLQQRNRNVPRSAVLNHLVRVRLLLSRCDGALRDTVGAVLIIGVALVHAVPMDGGTDKRVSGDLQCMRRHTNPLFSSWLWTVILTKSPQSASIVGPGNWPLMSMVVLNTPSGEKSVWLVM